MPVALTQAAGNFDMQIDTTSVRLLLCSASTQSHGHGRTPQSSSGTDCTRLSARVAVSALHTIGRSAGPLSIENTAPQQGVLTAGGGSIEVVANV